MADESEALAQTLTPERIDELCREAMAIGMPVCPWLGTSVYNAHQIRKQAASITAMRAAAAKLYESVIYDTSRPLTLREMDALDRFAGRPKKR